MPPVTLVLKPPHRGATREGLQRPSTTSSWGGCHLQINFDCTSNLRIRHQSQLVGIAASAAKAPHQASCPQSARYSPGHVHQRTKTGGWGLCSGAPKQGFHSKGFWHKRTLTAASRNEQTGGPASLRTAGRLSQLLTVSERGDTEGKASRRRVGGWVRVFDSARPLPQAAA